MSHPNCTTILNYSPILCTFNRQQSTSTRALRKRLYLIERIKDARTIGVVCGTLAVDGHRLAIDRLGQLCRRSDKHLYMFSIGKLNVPKLSNFAIDIDVFVLIACPFATILDNGEYYRPIVSMFEAEMALNRDRSWFAECGWTAEFGRLLSGMSDHMCDLCFKDDLDDNCKQLEATPDLSLITGRIRSDNLITNDGAIRDNTTAIQVYSSGELNRIVDIISTYLGDYFQTRSWKGLLPPESIDQQSSVIVTTAEPGRSGIAAHYDVEPTNN
jgi:diphthamide biosynthesis protein 2